MSHFPLSQTQTEQHTWMHFPNHLYSRTRTVRQAETEAKRREACQESNNGEYGNDGDDDDDCAGYAHGKGRDTISIIICEYIYIYQ